MDIGHFALVYTLLFLGLEDGHTNLSASTITITEGPVFGTTPGWELGVLTLTTDTRLVAG